jgi:hypothetical protein
MSQVITNLVAAYDAKRTERLAADKVAQALASEEAALKQELINAMRDEELFAAGNAYVQFTLRRKTKYQAMDWEQIQNYIVDNGAWDLIQRRLSETAIVERGAAIPGIAAYEFDDLSRPQKVK